MANSVQERLDRLRKAADSSARNVRTVYLAFLVVGLYALVIVSTTTNERLLRGEPVLMPIVNVEVPVVWFFAVVPWLFLVLHINLLLQMFFLSRKLFVFNRAVNSVGSGTERSEHRAVLFPLPVSHMLVDSERRQPVRVLTQVMVVVVALVLPLGFLGTAQVMFLPYQSEFITCLHRLALAIDVILLWLLWPRIVDPDGSWKKWFFRSLPRSVLAVELTFLVTIWTVLVSEIPGGSMDRMTRAWLGYSDEYYLFLDRLYVFSGPLVAEEPAPEILAAYVTNEIRTQDASRGLEDENPDKINKKGPVADWAGPAWRKHVRPLELRNRSFRYARFLGVLFYNADLWGADFRNAVALDSDFQGADLTRTDFRGAVLSGSAFYAADFSHSDLRGADLGQGDFRGAEMRGARLDGADLVFADFRGAHLANVSFDGAVLAFAKLEAADATEASFRGAELFLASLQGARLDCASYLSEIEIEMRSSKCIDMRGAHLGGAKLRGARIANVDLRWADMRGIDLQSTADWDALVREVSPPEWYEPFWSAVERRFEEARARETSFNAISLEGAIYERVRVKDSVFAYESPLVAWEEQFSGSAFRGHDEANYKEGLLSYLLGLGCADEQGYVAHGIAKRTITDSVIGPELAAGMLAANCTGIEKGVDMLSEGPFPRGDSFREVAEEARTPEE